MLARLSRSPPGVASDGMAMPFPVPAVTDLVKAARQAVTVRTPRAGALRAALISEGAAVRADGPDRLEITGLGTEQVATLAAALGIPVFEINADTGSLEQAFLRLTAAEGRPG